MTEMTDQGANIGQETTGPAVGCGPAHHVHDEVMMDYASGACTEAEAVFIAAHLALCPECRHRVADFERVGGALLAAPEFGADSAGTAEGDPGDAFDALMDRIDSGFFADVADPVTTGPGGIRGIDHGDYEKIIPQPIRDYLTAPVPSLPWRSVMKGLDEVSLPIGDPASGRKARLLRIRAGTHMPRHTHSGSEMTIVLTGSFSDERGHFARGDVTVHDGEVDHQPVAGAGEDCLCFVVTDAPLRLTGAFSRFLNPFIKF